MKVPKTLIFAGKHAVGQIVQCGDVGGEYSAGYQNIQNQINQLRMLADKLEAFLAEAKRESKKKDGGK